MKFSQGAPTRFRLTIFRMYIEHMLVWLMVLLGCARHSWCWAFISIYMPHLFVNAEHSTYKLWGYSRSVWAVAYVYGFCVPCMPSQLGSRLPDLPRRKTFDIFMYEYLHIFFLLRFTYSFLVGFSRGLLFDLQSYFVLHVVLSQT